MPTYEVAYGVRLLDDVHNYFPALLYSQRRFMSTNQILHYIRYQIMTQFPRHDRIMPLNRAVDESLASAEFILNLLNTFVVHDDGRAAARHHSALGARRVERTGRERDRERRHRKGGV